MVVTKSLSRADWKTTLARIEALKPAIVVPGHYHANPDGSSPRSLASIHFTRAYLDAFEAAATKSETSDQLIARMKTRYPGLAQEPVLAISAKVVKGEIRWAAE